MRLPMRMDIRLPIPRPIKWKIARSRQQTTRHNSPSVISSTFMGTEPNLSDERPSAGKRAFVPEQEPALECVRQLPPELLQKAQHHDTKTRRGVFGQSKCGAFEDNVVLQPEGICLASVSPQLQDQIIANIEQFILYYPSTARSNRLQEIRAHIGET